jgi:hypothetical protein
LKIKLLHVDRRRLENELELGVLKEPVRVLSIASVGRPAGGLGIPDLVRPGTKNPEESLRRHGAGAHFHVIRLLKDAAPLRPETLKAKEQILKRECGGTDRGRAGRRGRSKG